MGTRHYVQIKKDGKLLVQLYGQWDGYVDHAGSFIVRFLRKKENREWLKTIDKHLLVTDEDSDEYQWGETVFGNIQEFTDISEYWNKLKSEDDYAESLIQAEIKKMIKRFGTERMGEYLLLTRDTGYKCLDCIKAFSDVSDDDRVKSYVPDAEITEMPEMIYAVYTIDVTAQTLRIITAAGIDETYPFSNLPTAKDRKRIDNGKHTLADRKTDKAV